MRLFIGIALPTETRAAIAEACDAYRDGAPAWREDKWVPEANLHVTLKFLGDVPEAQVEVVRETLAESCAAIAPFELELTRMKAVPSAKRATMLWVRGTEESERVGRGAALAGAIERGLEPLGFELETRPFKAHVTLVRTRRPRRADAEALAAADAVLARRANSVSVGAATLYSSVLGGPAPVYEPLAEVPLLGG